MDEQEQQIEAQKKQQSSTSKKKWLISIVVAILLVFYVFPFLLKAFTTDYNAMTATEYHVSFGQMIDKNYPNEGCFGLILNISGQQRCMGYKTYWAHYDTFDL